MKNNTRGIEGKNKTNQVGNKHITIQTLPDYCLLIFNIKSIKITCKLHKINVQCSMSEFMMNL